MPQILHDLPIGATRERVFEAIATPAGLDRWWTLRSEGVPEVGAEYEFFFSAGYDWRGRVVRAEAATLIEWEITRADADWTGTRVSLTLSERPDGVTWVRFAHAGWREENEHFRVSSNCWAQYLRLLRRWLEAGEEVPYDLRLDA
jgi:uncharacterized protein YndB with AHSA1/START domain